MFRAVRFFLPLVSEIRGGKGGGRSVRRNAEKIRSPDVLRLEANVSCLSSSFLRLCLALFSFLFLFTRRATLQNDDALAAQSPRSIAIAAGETATRPRVQDRAASPASFRAGA